MSRGLLTLRDWARRMAEKGEGRMPRPLNYGASYSPGTKTILVAATPSERLLWRQIADEIDAFLSRDEPGDEADGQADLFEATR